MGNDYKRPSASGDAPPIAAASHFDVTDTLIGKGLKEGRNPIMRDESGLELVVKATPGEVIEYLILDRQGEPVDQIGIREVDAKAKKTTCWECGVDENGDRHCWKVPCPVIVGPWKPGAALQMGLRFR